MYLSPETLTVGQLIIELQKLDPDLPAVRYDIEEAEGITKAYVDDWGEGPFAMLASL